MFGDPNENKNSWTKLTVKEAVKEGYIARPLDGNHGEKHPKGDDYVSEGVPFIMANDLVNKQVNFDGCHFITEKQAKTLTKGWSKEGDVLLTHKGTIGRIAIVQPSPYEDILLTPQVTYYRCLKNLDKEYLAAYFNTDFFIDQMQRLITGTTRACVTITQQEKLELIIPPMNMQRQFVTFVNQSDKSKFIKFKSQFIEMFGVPFSEECTTNGKFKDFTLEMLKGPFGSDMKKSLLVDKGEDTYKVYLQINALQQNEHIGESYISKEYYDNKMNRFTAYPGDYLITCDGTLGKFIRLDCDMEPGVISPSLLKIKLNEDRIIPRFFEAYWELFIVDYLVARTRNTALVHLPSAKIIGEVNLYIPDIDQQHQYAEFAKQSDKSK